MERVYGRVPNKTILIVTSFKHISVPLGNFENSCQICKLEGAKWVYSDEHQSPYVHWPGPWGGRQWIGYDNKESLTVKVSYLQGSPST
jgi:hypothetical protein